MGWVDPWVGLGWVKIFQFLVGWVGSTTAIVYFFSLGLHCELLVLVCLLCVLNISCFYRAVLCIGGTSHGPVSVCPSVRHKSVFY